MSRPIPQDKLDKMPQWKCHKLVRAAKIQEIVIRVPVAEIVLFTGDTVTVGHDWIERHKPEVGGYLIKYEDDYVSYSPTKAFEDGYTRYYGEPNTLASIAGRDCQVEFLREMSHWPIAGYPAVAHIHAVDGPMVQMSEVGKPVEDAFWINVNQIGIFWPR